MSAFSFFGGLGPDIAQSVAEGIVPSLNENELPLRGARVAGRGRRRAGLIETEQPFEVRL